MNNPKYAKALRYTKHALERMSERGVSKKRIRQAIEQGEVRFMSIKWRVVHDLLTVYFNKDGVTVVTVYYDEPSQTTPSKELHKAE